MGEAALLSKLLSGLSDYQINQAHLANARNTKALLDKHNQQKADTSAATQQARGLAVGGRDAIDSASHHVVDQQDNAIQQINAQRDVADKEADAGSMMKLLKVLMSPAGAFQANSELGDVGSEINDIPMEDFNMDNAHVGNRIAPGNTNGTNKGIMNILRSGGVGATGTGVQEHSMTDPKTNYFPPSVQTGKIETVPSDQVSSGGYVDESGYMTDPLSQHARVQEMNKPPFPNTEPSEVPRTNVSFPNSPNFGKSNFTANRSARSQNSPFVKNGFTTSSFNKTTNEPLFPEPSRLPAQTNELHPTGLRNSFPMDMANSFSMNV